MKSTFEVKVRYVEVDRGQVAYHAHYFVWLDMARTDFLKQRGISYRELEERGFFFVVAETRCRYIQSVGFDDLIRIETSLKSLHPKRVEFEYEIYKNSEKVSEAYTKLLILNRMGRPVRMPADLFEGIGKK